MLSLVKYCHVLEHCIVVPIVVNTKLSIILPMYMYILMPHTHYILKQLVIS